MFSFTADNILLLRQERHIYSYVPEIKAPTSITIYYTDNGISIHVLRENRLFGTAVKSHNFSAKI